MGDDQKKAFERSVFESFALVVGLPVDEGTVRQDPPPAPDILCRIAGEDRAFELTRLTEKELERQFSTGDFSFVNYKIEASDVVALIRRKQEIAYGVSRVDLLIHESVTPIDDLWLFDQETVDKEIQAAVDIAPFDRVWVFDETSKRFRFYRKADRQCC